MAKLKYVQPKGEQTCLLYVMANLLDAEGIISEDAKEIWNEIPPGYSWTQVEFLVEKFSFENMGATLLAATVADSDIRLDPDMFTTSLAINEGMFHEELRDYRGFLVLTTRGEKGMKNLHACCVLTSRNSYMIIDPYLEDIRYVKFTREDVIKGTVKPFHDIVLRLGRSISAVYEFTEANGAYGVTFSKAGLHKLFKINQSVIILAK